MIVFNLYLIFMSQKYIIFGFFLSLDGKIYTLKYNHVNYFQNNVIFLKRTHKYQIQIGVLIVPVAIDFSMVVMNFSKNYSCTSHDKSETCLRRFLDSGSVKMVVLTLAGCAFF